MPVVERRPYQTDARWVRRRKLEMAGMWIVAAVVLLAMFFLDRWEVMR